MTAVFQQQDQRLTDEVSSQAKAYAGIISTVVQAGRLLLWWLSCMGLRCIAVPALSEQLCSAMHLTLFVGRASSVLCQAASTDLSLCTVTGEVASGCALTLQYRWACCAAAYASGALRDGSGRWSRCGICGRWTAGLTVGLPWQLSLIIIVVVCLTGHR